MFAAKNTKQAAAAANTDAQFPYVSLLLNDTGTNGAQNNTFQDGSTNNFTITRNGTPTQGSYTPYWPDGQWGNYFNGSSSLTTSGTACFSGTQDFTVEMWLFWPSIPTSDVPLVGGVGASGSSVGIFNFASNIGIVKSGGGTTVYFGSKNQLTANQWNHLAITRSGNSHRCFINGTLDSAGVVTSTADWGTPTNTYVGSQTGTTTFLTGYISNLRIIKGTAVYTSNFTPSTTPLTAITNTSLLTCQSNRFKDNSSNAFAITATGTPQVTPFCPFEPSVSYSTTDYAGSGYFNNSSSSYLTISDNAALNMDASDFTFECWYYPLSARASMLTSKKGSTFANQGVNVFSQSDNTIKLEASTNGTSWNISITSSNKITVNAWNHVAVTRNGNVWTLWINGVSGGTVTVSGTVATNTAALYIGQLIGSSGYEINGYLSNWRLVKGTAVYTAAFTPPTAPVTAIANTSLLLDFKNAGIYDATTINDLTTVGDAQVSTAQSKWGGSSAKFDGTGDWLTVPDNPMQRLGSGDFTIDGWFYLSATGVAYGIISKGTSTTGWSVNVTSGNKLQFSYTSSNLTGGTSLSSGTWYYFAVVRSGTATGNLKIYLNGSADATSSGAVTDNFNQTSTLYIGADRTGGSALNGYIDDLRVTNGYARTISTPSASFPTR